MSEEFDRLTRAGEANAEHRVVRIDGDVVHRPGGPGTETVHDLLRHLRAKGITSVPEPLGIEGGIELLRLIPGDSGGDAWAHQHSRSGLESAARLLREIHDAGADWIPPTDAVWGFTTVVGDEGGDDVFCHGDPGPWNMVWREGRAVGLIDWDFLHPAPRLDDVAYALRWFAPARSDEMVLDWHHFPVVPDRAARIRAFTAAYGGLPDFDAVDEMVRSIRAVTARMLELAEQGVEPQRTWVRDGAVAGEEAEIRWIEDHRRLLA